MNSSNLDGKSWQGRNYLYPKEMLNKGEWLGSTNGCFYLKFEEHAGNMGFVVYYNKLKCTDGKGNDTSSSALYQLPRHDDYAGMTTKLNKVRLIGDDTKIHEYPDNLVTQGQNFYYMGQYSNTGNNISQHTGQIFDASSCGALCLEDNNCAGFVINNDKHCYLKNNKMFPMSNRKPQPNTHTKLYIRSKAVKNSLSCPNEVEQTSALQWELYPIGDKMNINTLCELGLASKEDRAALKEANDELMNMKGNMSSNLNKLQREDAK